MKATKLPTRYAVSMIAPDFQPLKKGVREEIKLITLDGWKGVKRNGCIA